MTLRDAPLRRDAVMLTGGRRLLQSRDVSVDKEIHAQPDFLDIFLDNGLQEGQQSLRFFGIRVSDNELAREPDKIKVVHRNAPPPWKRLQGILSQRMRQAYTEKSGVTSEEGTSPKVHFYGHGESRLADFLNFDGPYWIAAIAFSASLLLPCCFIEMLL